jgi:hypothetical protein
MGVADMNKRQCAKMATRKKATDPIQEAWDVLADYLLALRRSGNCFFVARDWSNPEIERLSLESSDGVVRFVSNPIRR